MRNSIGLLFIAVFFACCASRKQKQVSVIVAKDYTADTNHLIRTNAARLDSLLNKKDSLGAYIRENIRLFDSIYYTEENIAKLFFLENIIQQHNNIINDTSLKKTLLESYAFWGINQPPDVYNDSAVSRLEQFLLLTKDQQPAHSLTPYVFQALGIQYNVLGDLKKTCDYHNLSIKMAMERKYKELVVAEINNTVIALNEMHLYDSTIHLLNEFLSDKDMSVERKIHSYIHLSEAYAGKKMYRESIAAAKRSLAILPGIMGQIDSSEYLELQFMANWNIGDILLASGQLTEANTSLSKALLFLKQKNAGNFKSRESGKFYLSLGRLTEANGKPGTALSAYHMALACVTNIDNTQINALPLQKDLYKENTIMDALDAMADVLQKLYDKNKDDKLLKHAISCYELAYAVETKLTQNFSYDESLSIQAAQSKKRSDKAIAACFELYKISGQSLWTEKALVFAEKSKALVLQESIKRNIAAGKNNMPDSAWQNVETFQQQVNYYQDRLTLSDPTDTGKIKIFKEKLAEAEKNLLFAKTTLQHTNSPYRESLLQEDSISIPLIKNKLLDDHSALFECFAGDSSSYIFLITKNNTPVFIKCDNNFLQNSIRFLSFFTDKNKINNDPVAYQAAAYDLYNNTPIATVVSLTTGIEKLLIIPDGILNAVPFEALLTRINKGASPVHFNYLVNDCDISYGYSASTLIKQIESKTNKGSITAMAPVFPNNERENTALQYSVDELEAIRKELPSGKYFFRETATFGEFKKNIHSSSIIHIASHAHADTTAGETQPRIEFYDSTLYLNELYAMHINPRLVVLSACETGIGRIDKSEGAMSLARGFYYAGAKNIITSLWSVDDKSTSVLFSRFYANSSCNNYAAALRNSKLDYLKNASITTASPYYWAGFVHIGYDRPEKKKINLWLLAGGCLLLASLSFFIFYKRKK